MAVKADFGKGEAIAESRGAKPWDVGSVERIRCWFLRGTWKIAQPRGVWSHLSHRTLDLSQGHKERDDRYVLVTITHEKIRIQTTQIHIYVPHPMRPVDATQHP